MGNINRKNANYKFSGRGFESHRSDQHKFDFCTNFPRKCNFQKILILRRGVVFEYNARFLCDFLVTKSPARPVF